MKKTHQDLSPLKVTNAEISEMSEMLDVLQSRLQEVLHTLDIAKDSCSDLNNNHDHAMIRRSKEIVRS